MKELGYQARVSDDAMVINMVNDAVGKRRRAAEDQELLFQDCSRRQARAEARWRKKERRALAQCGGGAAVIVLAYLEMCQGNVAPGLAATLIIGALMFVCIRGGWHLSEARGRR